MSGRMRAGWILTLLLALGLRIGFDVATLPRPLQGDELNYDQIAWNLASGHGISVGTGAEPRQPTALRGPGFVVLLAATYRLAGHGPLALLLLQALLDTLAVLLVGRIGRRLFGSEALALGGALIYALYPPFVQCAGQVLSETWVNVTLLAAVERGLAWAESRRLRPLVLSGSAMGLCAASKLQLAPVAVWIVLAGHRRWWTPACFAHALLQVALVTAVLAPWIVRNERVFHAFIPGVSTGGQAFWGGAGPVNGQTIGGLDDPRVPASVHAAIRGLGELETDRWFAAEAKRIVRRDPAHWALLAAEKFCRLWFNLMFDTPPSRTSLALAAAHLLAWALCFWSLARLAPSAAGVRLLGWLFAHFTLVHVLFYAVVRYAFPCYAYVFSFSGAAALALAFPSLRRRRAAGVAAPRARTP